MAQRFRYQINRYLIAVMRRQFLTHARIPAARTSGNMPIRSAHTGGAAVVYADGSVHFLSNATDLNVLYALAARSDGQVYDLP